MDFQHIFFGVVGVAAGIFLLVYSKQIGGFIHETIYGPVTPQKMQAAVNQRLLIKIKELEAHVNEMVGKLNVGRFTSDLTSAMGGDTGIRQTLINIASLIYARELGCKDVPPLDAHDPYQWKRQWDKRWDFVETRKHRLENPETENALRETLLYAFAQFVGELPQLDNGIFKVSLASLLTSTKPFDKLFEQFKDPTFFLCDQAKNYYANCVTAEALVKAKFFERNSPKHFQALLGNTYFPSLLDAQISISLPEKARFEGTWICAPRGRGKTTCLSVLLKEDLDAVRDGKASLILMDSKGDLIDYARKLKRFSPVGDLAGKLVLIEPTPNLSINPLDLGASTGHTISLLEYVFASLLETKMTPLQSTLFRMVLIACKAIPRATFATFRQILADGWEPFQEHIFKLEEDDRDFFLKEFDGKTYKETKSELLWRIRKLTTEVPLLRDMFRAPTTKLDIGKEMDAGKVIIIDNSAALLGQGSIFFARFFVALVLSAAQQRAGRKDDAKLPVYFYIDEADTVIANDEKVAEILNRCRSQKIGMVFAHQALQQIKSDDVKAALADCAIRMANSDEEASQLAPRLRTTPEALRALDKGQFALFIRDHLKEAITVDIPNDPISDWTPMEGDEFADIQKEMKRKYCYIPSKAVPEPPEPEDDTAAKSWGKNNKQKKSEI